MRSPSIIVKAICVSAIAATAFMSSCMLGGCRSVSAAQAANNPMLASLPLLTVRSVTSTPVGYTATVVGSDGDTYSVVANKSTTTEYVSVSTGDSIKVDGNYSGENPVTITAIQIFKIR